jgi:hypothetical protein
MPAAVQTMMMGQIPYVAMVGFEKPAPEKRALLQGYLTERESE